jgi:hypothetical protein
LRKLLPETRTIRALQAAGYLAQKVEQQIHGTHIKRDLFGFLDVLAIRGDEILGVQATSLSHVSDRIKKIEDHENLPAVRKANISIQVWGWGDSETPRIVDIS